MKKILMAFAASMTFGYAAAQMEPKTNQQQKSDTIVPPATADPESIANKGIIKRNTLEAGSGKPDNIKRKLNVLQNPINPKSKKVVLDTLPKSRL
ncbi:hypothetical protein [Flavobacterium sp.]